MPTSTLIHSGPESVSSVAGGPVAADAAAGEVRGGADVVPAHPRRHAVVAVAEAHLARDAVERVVAVLGAGGEEVGHLVPPHPDLRRVAVLVHDHGDGVR